MDQIVAFTALIIRTGLIAKVFPKIMTKIFDHYPQHFSPTHKSGPEDEISSRVVDEGDQAATLPVLFSARCSGRSTNCPSLKATPARTSGRRSCASSRRQVRCAASSSLNAIVSPAVREPAPWSLACGASPWRRWTQLGWCSRDASSARPGSRSESGAGRRR